MGLMTAMASRLQTLESELRSTRIDLQIRTATVETLEAELAWEKEKNDAQAQGRRRTGLAGRSNGDDEDEDEDDEGRTRHLSLLETRCQDLMSQVAEMEAFLQRNGMMWRKEKDACKVDPEHGHVRGKRSDSVTAVPRPSYRVAFPYDFPRLVASIRELNHVAGEGVATVTKDARGTRRLKAPDTLSLAIFRNGFKLGARDFRSYKDRKAHLFVQDLVDGYFPYELKDAYPDGVPFDVHDRHEEWHEVKEAHRAFAGKGRATAASPDLSDTDGSADSETDSDRSETVDVSVPVPSHMTWTQDVSVVAADDPTSRSPSASAEAPLISRPVAATSNVRGLDSIGSAPRPQTTAAFLKTLPSCVIRSDGTIEPIRSNIARLLSTSKPNSTSPTLSSASSALETEIHLPYPDHGGSGEEGAESSSTLRIHAPDDGRRFLVHGRGSHTVRDVRAALVGVTMEAGEWELRTALQGVGVVYGDAMTLKECGLVGRARLYTRVRMTS
ncbi:UBX domain-containing protein 11 [Thoreauomyces humboldtii]|nr:UBX domain-containing protein 11 [Thoreauomyces humboldtii]